MNGEELFCCRSRHNGTTYNKPFSRRRRHQVDQVDCECERLIEEKPGYGASLSPDDPGDEGSKEENLNHQINGSIVERVDINRQRHTKSKPQAMSNAEA